MKKELQWTLSGLTGGKNEKVCTTHIRIYYWCSNALVPLKKVACTFNCTINVHQRHIMYVTPCMTSHTPDRAQWHQIQGEFDLDLTFSHCLCSKAKYSNSFQSGYQLTKLYQWKAEPIQTRTWSKDLKIRRQKITS